MATCDYCGGSGNDAVIPSKRCYKCGGLGVIPDQPKIRQPGSGGSAGTALAGLLVIVLSASGYYFSAKIYFRYWTPDWQQSWLQFLLYAAVAIGFPVIATLRLGAILGFLSGLVFLIPLFFATQGGFDIMWLVIAMDADSGTNQALAWIMIAAGLIALLLLVVQMARRSSDFWVNPGGLSARKGTAGWVVFLAALIAYLSAAGTIYLATAKF